MEMKQNVKGTTTKNIKVDPIEELWKSNPRIPFMQSKEILKFGYEEGKKVNINNPTQKPKDDQSFTGTTKELIEHTDKKISEKKKSSTVNSKVHQFDIEQTRFNILSEVIEIIEKERDLMNTYSLIKTKKKDSETRLKELRSQIIKFGSK